MAERDGNEESSSRPVRNLQGLLNFCTEITAREDNTHASSVQLTEERRQFLENVFRGMQGDIPKQMADCLKKLTEECVNSINEDISEQENALEELADHVEDINHALDLDKMNGFPILLNIMTCPHHSLQKRAAQVIADVCQNNESGQKSMLSFNAMQILLNIVDTHENTDCKVKALYALSCLTRDCDIAEKQFADLSGFCYLMRAIQTRIPKLVMKSVFLLNYFIEKTDDYKDTLLAMGFVEQLVSLLNIEDFDNTSREFCTLSLLNLASSYSRAVNECLRPEFQLISQLQERKKIISGKEEFEEEENYIDSLLKLLEENEMSEESMLR